MSEPVPSSENRSRRRLVVWLSLGLFVCLGGGALFVILKNKKVGGMPEIRIDRTDGYRLLVDGKPFLIRGVCYNPVPVGESFQFNFWTNSYPVIDIDGELMKQANVNTVRFYRSSKNPEEGKRMIRTLHEKYGIFTLLGHSLGFWEWPPADYSDPEARNKTKEQVLEMVRMYQNEPGILGWILGNENNYSFDLGLRPWSTPEIDALPTEEARRLERAKIYYTWINDMALEIKKIDTRHPVIMGVGETKSIDSIAQYARDVDVLGVIAYRGPSFGTLFREVKQKIDKPMMLIEFGSDRFNSVTQTEEETHQAEFIKTQWRDVLKNSAFIGGTKNCIGGTLFEWTDEWWKSNDRDPNSWLVQEPAADWRNPAYYFDADEDGHNNMNEEWWGIIRLDPSKKANGVDGRVPTKAYRLLQSMWAVDQKQP